jgi:hypothetical protein
MADAFGGFFLYTEYTEEFCKEDVWHDMHLSRCADPNDRCDGIPQPNHPSGGRHTSHFQTVLDADGAAPTRHK